jgi:serine/threonine protein kinase
LSPALLRRCSIISKGKPVAEHAERSKEPLTKEHVWWVLNGATKQYLAAYYSEKQRALNELSLLQCIEIWGTNPSSLGVDGMATEALSPGRAPSSALPLIPPKYVEFLRKRSRIFREINNMRKISPHVNVIRLVHVLELAQDSKCTIFLVMELANGGELFDRIKIDCGTRERTAKKFFLQLLAGVRHCHDEGVCHRDLKPENLLLQDFSSLPDGSILKVGLIGLLIFDIPQIADFGFSARVILGAEDLGDSPHHLNAATTLRSVVGSPFYVAPEVLQAQPQGYNGLKADAWSLGVILYAMLAGNLPFTQELSTCRRFKQFGIWAAEQCLKSPRFWEDPNLVYPAWLFSSKFSPSARSLIVAFLLPDPIARISVSESQKHPWCLLDEEEPPTPFRAPDCLPYASPVPSPLSAGEHSAFSPNCSAVSTPSHLVLTSETLPTAEPVCFGSPTRATALPLPSALAIALHSGTPPDTHSRIPQQPDGEVDQPTDGSADHTEPFVMDDTSDDGMEFDDEFKDKRPERKAHSQTKGDSHSESVFGHRLLGGKQSDSPPLAIPNNESPGILSISLSLYLTCPADLLGYSKRLNASTPTPIPRDSSNYHRRSFVTPPPVPFDEVPYIVAGTPDLLSSLVYGSSNEVPRSYASPVDSVDPIPIPNLQRGPSSGNGSSNPCHPPSFHDRVKKSTRFITSVPAHDVLETVEGILQQCRIHKTVSPIGLIGRVEVHWDNYRLDVWGLGDSLPSSQPACSLHLYQLPASTPQSPAREFSLLASSPLPAVCSMQGAVAPPQGTSSHVQSGGGGGGGSLYLVEFVRGQLEIFPFKRFYEWIRQRISELVKRDYAWDLFDQAGSPM